MQTESIKHHPLQLRMTEIETRESILEHLKDVAEGKLWKVSGHHSLKHYVQAELGYSVKEAREILVQIGEIAPAVELVSSKPEVQKRIERLKSWRKQKANHEAVAAYRIITNRTLLEIAERNPLTSFELGALHGIGTRKLELYGNELVALLQAE